MVMSLVVVCYGGVRGRFQLMGMVVELLGGLRRESGDGIHINHDIIHIEVDDADQH
jgi:hypothetical protein